MCIENSLDQSACCINVFCLKQIRIFTYEDFIQFKSSQTFQPALMKHRNVCLNKRSNFVFHGVTLYFACFCNNSNCLSSIFSLANSQYSDNISTPIALRRRFFATSRVVPDPANGSKTKSPSSVNNFINHSGNALGNAAL